MSLVDLREIVVILVSVDSQGRLLIFLLFDRRWFLLNIDLLLFDRRWFLLNLDLLAGPI